MAVQGRCPECGAANRAGARSCRICGAPLSAAAAQDPRLQRKVLRRTDFIAAARQNQANTRRLIVLLTLIGTALGYLVGWAVQTANGAVPPGTAGLWYLSDWGLVGAGVMLAASVLWTLIALKSGDRIVLRMTGAHQVSADEEPQLHHVVEEMAVAAGLPKPTVWVIETPAMNAFATGMRPERAAVAVTRGLLQRLTRDELQGVIGHEMGHIVDWDMRYATAVGVMVGLIALVSDGVLRSMYYYGGPRGRRRDGRSSQAEGILMLVMLVFAILAPLAAYLVQMAVSRQREFLADATSVRLTRNPQGLIGALEKLSAAAEPFQGANRATQHLFIVNPFRNFGERASALMATHPPLERRIERLRNLGA